MLIWQGALFVDVLVVHQGVMVSIECVRFAYEFMVMWLSYRLLVVFAIGCFGELRLMVKYGACCCVGVEFKNLPSVLCVVLLCMWLAGV